MLELNIDNPLGASVWFKEETNSTMDDAREAVDVDGQPGTVIAAGFQHKGRGRGEGRSWYSAPGDNLTFSVILDKNETLMSLRLGLALCHFLEACSHDELIEIKWPNDVLVWNKKIAGILCESWKGRIIAGIGININNKPDSGLRREAVSLSEMNLDSTVLSLIDPPAVLEAFLPFISNVLTVNLSAEDLVAGIESRLYRRGQNVHYYKGISESSSTLKEGRITGLSTDGGLKLLDVSGKMDCLYSGEIIY